MANITGKPRQALKNAEDAAEAKKTVTDADKQATAKKRVSSRNMDMNELVDVQSAVYGGLVYVSRKTGYIIEWQDFGSIQPLTVDELMTMRNSQPAFFKNGWVRLIGDNAEDVKHYLQLERYYTNELPFEDFDDVYELSAEDIIAVVSNLSDSMKESIARRAIDLIKDGVIDSNKKINAIETATGYDLSE